MPKLFLAMEIYKILAPHTSSHSQHDSPSNAGTGSPGKTSLHLFLLHTMHIASTFPQRFSEMPMVHSPDMPSLTRHCVCISYICPHASLMSVLESIYYPPSHGTPPGNDCIKDQDEGGVPHITERPTKHRHRRIFTSRILPNVVLPRLAPYTPAVPTTRNKAIFLRSFT